jgi:hypothetical protein
MKDKYTIKDDKTERSSSRGSNVGACCLGGKVHILCVVHQMINGSII